MIELHVVLPLRGTDRGGSGAFGAPRGTDDAGNPKYHKGIDFAAAKKSGLLSPIDGYVTKLGYPYGDDLTYRYVQVQDAEKNCHRFFYVEPIVELGDQVVVGTLLGTVQDVSARYPKVKPHVHYEIKRISGTYINPEFLWTS